MKYGTRVFVQCAVKKGVGLMIICPNCQHKNVAGAYVLC